MMSQLWKLKRVKYKGEHDGLEVDVAMDGVVDLFELLLVDDADLRVEIGIHSLEYTNTF